MDPVTLIMTAITAGVTAGLSDTASAAVKDAFRSLKDLARRRLGDRPGSEVVLERFTEDPEPWSGALRAELTASGAATDAELLDGSQRLLTLVREHAPATFNTTVTGDVKGFVQGNQNRVDMTFEA